MSDNALDVKGLSATVGGFKLQDINLSVQKGTIMGLIGENGAGKTTLIKSILNRIQREKGKVFFHGKELVGNEKAIKAKLGVVFDENIYPGSYKPKKIYKSFAPFYKGNYEKRFFELMERFKLDPNKKFIDYSKGMQVKFSIVMALFHDPDLIILDEPTAGIDPVARTDILDLVLDIMQNEEKSVLFSTHITTDLEKIADFITLIDRGRIVFSEQKDELLDSFAVVNVEESAMTDTLRDNLIGVKKSLFGYTGLSSDKEVLNGLSGIKLARPTIEDIMVYSNEVGGDIYD
ncbi:ABC transporter ATP-binding protein [Proteinivorax tanatarense]|uniref:ABC transporter ATP-binding protein n=1 Tax=Proteinivorax tanatarense TaxID=1260629 RepID=A0AAU7VML4_9FIRM